MRIKPRVAITRKQKAYLKWMGLLPPKKVGRLSSLNKHNRKMKALHVSEFVSMCNHIEPNQVEVEFV
jgi:hypothetical protein